MSAIEPEFIASFWTLAGSSHPLTCQGVSVVPLEERIEAAASTGYIGFSFIETDLAEILKTKSYAEIRKLLRSNGLHFVQLELITNWFATGEAKRQSDAVREHLLAAASELEADHIKVVGDFADQFPVAEMVYSFGELCTRAASAGTKIAVELTPLTNLFTPEECLQLIRQSGASNGGLLLDVWHMGRAHIPFDALADIPAELIYGVELDDADLKVRGTLMEDTMRYRRLPGQGELEPAKLIASVHKAGYRLPYGIEIISDDHRKLSVKEQACVAIEASRKQMKVAEQYL
jgi:sugar phosphate isomerase/epimerase